MILDAGRRLILITVAVIVLDVLPLFNRLTTKTLTMMEVSRTRANADYTGYVRTVF